MSGYTPYYSPWVDAVYDTDGNLVTPSPTPGTAAAFSWWDTNLAKAMPQSAKGDIVTYDGTDPAVRAVGAPGTFLAADPGDTTGLGWVLPNNWTPVTAYGALGDGTSDDTIPIQDTLNAVGPGGTVYFPNPSGGSYRTSAPLNVPPNITVVMQHSDTLQYTGAAASPNSIKPLGSFGGATVLVLQDKTLSGASTDYVGTRLVNLTIDGTALVNGNNVKGIQLIGLIRETSLDNCTVRRVGGTGFDFAANSGLSPQSCRLRGCLADNVGAAGYSFSNVPDTTIIDCNSEGAGWIGFYLAGLMNGVMIGCRSEWSAQYGYYVTSGYWGTGQGSGGLNMLACLSDRNNYDGVFIDATGADTVQITGCKFRRDGRAGGTTYAAVRGSAATMPINVVGSSSYPGVNDDGTGTLTPYAGLSATGCTEITWSAGKLWGVTTPVVDGGTNGVLAISASLGTTTGAASAPTRVKPAERVNVVTASGTAQTLPDPASYPMSDVTLTGNCTFTFPTARAGTRFTLALHQDATGGRTVTWPANTIVKWPSGTAPTLVTTANANNVLSFVCTNATTGWIGSANALGAA